MVVGHAESDLDDADGSASLRLFTEAISDSALRDWLRHRLARDSERFTAPSRGVSAFLTLVGRKILRSAEAGSAGLAALGVRPGGGVSGGGHQP